jgi:hypothetical protein
MKTIRREFSLGVELELIRRATQDGRLNCERCGSWLKSRADFELHHRRPEGLAIDKARRPTVDDGEVLCMICHDEQTALDVASIAKAKRVEKKQPLKLGGMPEIFRRFMGKERP